MKWVWRRLRSPVLWLLAAGLAVSIGSLVVFLFDTGLSDKNLLILPAILRYSSLVVFVCSVYLLFKIIFDLFRRKIKAVSGIVKILLCLILIFLCIVIFFLETLIVVFSGGTLG